MGTRLCLDLEEETAGPFDFALRAALNWIISKAAMASGVRLGFGDLGVAWEQRSLMQIVGCDFHAGHQQIAWVDTVTGEVKEDHRT